MRVHSTISASSLGVMGKPLASVSPEPSVFVVRLEVRASLAGRSTRRAALYVRVSTADRGQTIDNQLQPLHEATTHLS